MRNKIKYIISLYFAIFIAGSQFARAGGPPEPSPFNNPTAIVLLVLMLILLIVIGILANVLIGTADIKCKKREKSIEPKNVISAIFLLPFLTISSAIFAQADENAEAITKAAQTIGGMSASSFYVMASVIFLELSIIVILLINIKFLIKAEKESIDNKIEPGIEAAKSKKNKLSWWARFNKLKPVSEEAYLDVGHDYDGIRELNNRLPPWWLYGFYVSIIFAVVYLWRFHVAHTGPSSIQEYQASVAKAELKTQEFLKEKGEAMDENSVTVLTNPTDIAVGKAIFVKSCAVCHREDGGGMVGPNLTDDYWLHGHDIKNIFKTIRYGINAMPQWQNTYSNKEIAQVSTYVKTLHNSKPPGAKASEGTLEKEETAAPAPADSTQKK